MVGGLPHLLSLHSTGACCNWKKWKFVGFLTLHCQWGLWAGRRCDVLVADFVG